MIEIGITSQLATQIGDTLRALGVTFKDVHQHAPYELRSSEPIAWAALTFWSHNSLRTFERLADEVAEEWGSDEMPCRWVWAAGADLPELAQDIRCALSLRRSRRHFGRELLRQHIGQMRRDTSYGVGIPVRDLPLLAAGLTAIASARAAAHRTHIHRDATAAALTAGPLETAWFLGAKR